MSKHRMSKEQRIGFGFLAVLSLCVFAFAGTRISRNLERRRTLHKAQEEMKKNFWALAFENLDPLRQDLTKNDQDCKILLDVYTKLKRVERLQWATEACLESGVNTYEVYLSLATAYELQGQDQEALQTLSSLSQQASQRFEAFQKMAAIYSRNHDETRAADAMIKAAQRVDDAQMKLDAVQMAISQNRPEDVKILASAIREVKTDNPEVKLIVARAFYKLENYTDAREQLNQAKELMTKMDPERKKKLEHDYADVFKIQNSQAAR